MITNVVFAVANACQLRVDPGSPGCRMSGDHRETLGELAVGERHARKRRGLRSQR
jgi:hypothetical protein